MADARLRFHPDMQAEWVPAHSLRQHPENPNNGDVENTIESLIVNGCYRPVWVSRMPQPDGTHHIVGGNTLYEALITLGVQMIPTSWVDCKTRIDELRVLAVDNESARRGIMDPGLELEMVQAILDADATLLGSGYTEERYAQMVEDAQEPFEAEEADVQTMEVECVQCGHINLVPL